MRYLKAALTLLDKAQLLNSLDFDSVGGKDTLNRCKTIYEASPSAFLRPILLLYDCETNKPQETSNNFWVLTLPHNSENTIVKHGIENLFSESLLKEFGNCLHTTTKKGYGDIFLKLNKKGLCHWICDERKYLTDFENFDSVIEILEEFSAAHQPSEVES